MSGKPAGLVSWVTFCAIVDANAVSESVSSTESYEYVRSVFEGDDQSAKDELIKLGKEHTASLTRGSNAPGKPGRKPLYDVQSAIGEGCELAGITPTQFATMDKNSSAFTRANSFVKASMESAKAAARLARLAAK